MENFAAILFHAHSGIRYLVLLAGLIVFGYTLASALANRPWDRGGRILLKSFIGVVDLQVLLGLVLVFVSPFYPALWGHIMMMVLAAAAAHVTSVVIRKRGVNGRSHLTAALGSAGTLIMIVGGVMAIGRPIF